VRIVEADAAADGIEETGVLKRGINPHRGVRVQAGLTTLFAFDDFAVNLDIKRAGGPVAETGRETDDPRST
jgi:hypothetical protein